jgi:triacylglycerol lipase
MAFDFHPAANAYDPLNALWLGRAAELAYDERTRIADVTARWGFGRLAFFSGLSTQAFLATNEDMWILAFRGTEPDRPADILTDARIALQPWRDVGRIHRGFSRALDEIWNEVVAEVRHGLDRPRKLWITGHSLGGALAVLAAAEFQASDLAVDLQGVYTFGQPRVSDAPFAAWFDATLTGRVVRHVNFRDYVTMIPLLAMRYRHVGVERYFDQDGVARDGAPAWGKVLEYFWWVSRWLDSKPDLGLQHAMSIYLANLERQLPGA